MAGSYAAGSLRRRLDGSGVLRYKPAGLAGENAIETYYLSLYPVSHYPSSDCHPLHPYWIRFQRQAPLLQFTNPLAAAGIFSALYVNIFGGNASTSVSIFGAHTNGDGLRGGRRSANASSRGLVVGFKLLTREKREETIQLLGAGSYE